MCEGWCFDHVVSSLHYPKSNGFIERTVQTVKITLKKAKYVRCALHNTGGQNVAKSGRIMYTRTVQGILPVRMIYKLGNKDEIYERLKQR